jgi:hypothetical protein
MKWLWGRVVGLSVCGVVFFLASTSPEEAQAHLLAWWTWFYNLKLVDWLVREFPSSLPHASSPPVRLVASLALAQILSSLGIAVLLVSIVRLRIRQRVRRLRESQRKQEGEP